MKLKTFLTVAILALFFQGIAGAVSSAAIKSVLASEESAAAAKSEVVVHQVELYVTSWCPYCKQAENFFRSQGIPFIAYVLNATSSWTLFSASTSWTQCLLTHFVCKFIDLGFIQE
jgi:hypothetical protein